MDDEETVEPQAKPSMWQRPEPPVPVAQDETQYLYRYCTNCCYNKLEHWEKIFETCGPSQNDKPELREIAELIEEFEQNIAHNATLGC